MTKHSKETERLKKIIEELRNTTNEDGVTWYDQTAQAFAVFLPLTMRSAARPSSGWSTSRESQERTRFRAPSSRACAGRGRSFPLSGTIRPTL